MGRFATGGCPDERGQGGRGGDPGREETAHFFGGGTLANECAILAQPVKQVITRSTGRNGSGHASGPTRALKTVGRFPSTGRLILKSAEKSGDESPDRLSPQGWDVSRPREAKKAHNFVGVPRSLINPF